jgi:hypothetical protein
MKKSYLPKDPKNQTLINDSQYNIPKHLQLKEREDCDKFRKVNSDYIFKHKDYKKHTKGYDKLTGEIEKRGRPADNQKEIFLKKPEPEKTFAQIKKQKEKNDAKKREALNAKLYKQRLKTKWDRGW